MRLKKKVKKRLKSFILIIIVLSLGFYLYKSMKTNNNKPEDSEIIRIMKEHNIEESKYSKTLEYVLKNNLYDSKYLDEYKDININYNKEENFDDIITTFLPKGYKGKEINYLLKLSNKNIEYLKENDYVDISNYYEYKNFDASKIERYNNFKESNNYEYKDIITYVNINLDLDVYTNTKETEDPKSLNVLVNKYNHLPKNWAPDDLINLDGAYGNKVPMRSILKDDFLKLQKAAKEEIGINLLPTTAYRNYNFQTTLYNNYVAKDGVKAADTYSARPGYSEHQTGLAIDLKNTALNNARLTEDNYNWLENNAYKYGFIIRFPKDKEFITGYKFENWHIRYVGKDAAKIIYDNNLTLEEYIDLYVTEY